MKPITYYILSLISLIAYITSAIISPEQEVTTRLLIITAWFALTAEIKSLQETKHD